MADIFPEIPVLEYGGPDCKDPMKFRHYNPETMASIFRFAMAAWHSVCNGLADPFGEETIVYPWDGLSESKATEQRMVGLGELAYKLRIPFVCFHGRDLFTDHEDFRQQEKNYRAQAKLFKSIIIDGFGRKLGWGTENLFGPKMYAQGSLNSPFPRVVARAAAEVKLMLGITDELEGENYVLWGGRVGYQSMLVNDVEMELGTTLPNIYRMIAHHVKKNFSRIQLLEEPKAKEPKYFQYARDVATTLNFLRAIELLDMFKLNIEGNHAELAGLTLEHELLMARMAGGLIGGIDANSGAFATGWDVDRYQENLLETVLAWNQVDLQGGLGTGVINHDAKPRRESTSIIEKVIGHRAAMDLWARGRKVVEAAKKDGRIAKIRQETYAGFDKTAIGRSIRDGRASLDSLTRFSRKNRVGEIPSGRYQEAMAILHDYIDGNVID